jgi:hypothetical protein
MKKHTINEYTAAIIAKDEGTTYLKVLEEFNLTPTQFHKAVKQYAKKRTIDNTTDLQKITSILENPARTKELFNMGEEAIIEQYKKLMQGKIIKLYPGIFEHQKNLEFLSFTAIRENNPEMNIENRTNTIEVIQSLPSALKKYFKSIGLGAMMVHGLKNNERNSPIKVLKLFDIVYMNKTKNPSLFDPKTQNYINWEKYFKVQQHSLKQQIK